jgi:hypothetical protein
MKATTLVALVACLFVPYAPPVSATAKGAIVNVSDVVARKRRLEEMSPGLGKELVLIEECQGPLLYLERKHYLGSLRDALGGIECARVVQARARQRLQGEQPTDLSLHREVG